MMWRTAINRCWRRSCVNGFAAWQAVSLLPRRLEHPHPEGKNDDREAGEAVMFVKNRYCNQKLIVLI